MPLACLKRLGDSFYSLLYMPKACPYMYIQIFNNNIGYLIDYEKFHYC